jgi:Tol biopolymer transport system component
VKNGELADGPQMLPGGQVLLFTIASGASADRWGKAQIVVQSLKSGERKTLIEAGSDARYLPTGHIVYALGGVLYAVPFDLNRLQVMAGPVPILEGIRRAGAQQTGVAHFSVANGGSLMFIPGPVSAGGAQSDLALFDGKGGTEALKLPPGSYSSPRISPDGKYVAFGNDDGKEVSVWVYELSGASSMRRLTFGGNNQSPIWSSDGRRVAFSSDREGDGAIFWQKADGTGTAERLTRAEQGTTQVPKSWSPDGKQFLFEAVKGSSVSLWTFSLQDRKSTLIAGVQSTGPLDPMFSPDGRWIAYRSTQMGADQIYVQPFPSTGAKYQITKSGGHKSVWSPDGKQLFYVPGGAQFAVVTIATQPSFTFGNPEPL